MNYIQKKLSSIWNYKTFIIFIILTAIWSSLFSTIKYFFWWNLQSWVAPDLQVLSWYLSLGWILAYIVWWALSYTFLKKYLLFSFSFLTLLFVLLTYFVPIQTDLGLAIVMSSIWFFYGLWVIFRSILVSVEIQKTWLWDTKVNGIVSIVFIIFLIIWTIAWSKIYEMWWHNGSLFIIWLLILSTIISLFLDYDKITLKSLLKNGFKSYEYDRKQKFTKAIKSFIPELKYIFKNFWIIIISSSVIRSVSTVVSQKSVEYSVSEFSKLPSEAAFLLLYSSVWVIIWNVVSAFLWKYRWVSFFILNILLWILILIFPFFNETYMQVWIIASFVWFVFWASTNLIDAYYLNEIWEQNKKEYGSSTYGLVLSIILFLTMFIASSIDKAYGFDVLMYFLWTVILIVNILNFKKILWK